MKTIFTFLLAFVSSFALAQFGVNFHQSNLPFVGLNYEIANRARPEIRLGTDQYFEDVSIEAVMMADIIDKEDYEFYGGVGIFSNDFEALAIPIGVNIYPLPNKKFGFHIELTPLLPLDDDETILRGSWGIRYRFRKSE